MSGDPNDVDNAKPCSSFITAAIEVINIVALFVEVRLVERFVVAHAQGTKKAPKDASIIVIISVRFVSENAMPNLM